MAGSPRIHSFWIEQIKAHARNRPNLSAAAIRRLLTEKNAPPDSGGVPDVRSVRRVLQEFRKLGADQQRHYDWFRWPQSMESAQLPWEAARTVLDLIRYHAEETLPPPLLKEAQWFWRITLAIPYAPIQERHRLTTLLLDTEGHLGEWLEMSLAFQPWRSPADADAYESLPISVRGQPPITSRGEWVTVTAEEEKQLESQPEYREQVRKFFVANPDAAALNPNHPAVQQPQKRKKTRRGEKQR